MRPSTLIPLLLAVSAGTQAADIYCEQQGRDCSDRPRPGAVLISKTAVARSEGESGDAGASAAGGTAGTAAARTIADPVAAQKVQNASREAMQKDVAAKRSEQCKQAQEKYQSSVAARRIYKTNKSGEREYLSDSQADELRLNARVAMEEVCGKG